MKINNFRGDLTDNSAKKEALDISSWRDGDAVTVEQLATCHVTLTANNRQNLDTRV